MAFAINIMHGYGPGDKMGPQLQANEAKIRALIKQQMGSNALYIILRQSISAYDKGLIMSGDWLLL